MTISILDCFYMFSIVVIIGFITHLEMQIRMIKVMMEEHVRCDDNLAELSKKLQKSPSQNS